MPSDPAMTSWRKTGFIATIIIVLAFPAYLVRLAFERSKPVA